MKRDPTEMELRVAESLWIADAGGRRLEPWSDIDPEWQARWVRSARAAIRAMREPTTDMLREAGIGSLVTTEENAGTWEVMIDAASPPEVTP